VGNGDNEIIKAMRTMTDWATVDRENPGYAHAV